MRKFCVWSSRRVVFFTEEFPLRLTILQDVVEELDLEFYCPALQSLLIQISNHYNLSDGCHLESNLSVFLGHCHNLRRVVIRFDANSDTLAKNLSERIFRVLEETMRENSLVEFTSAYTCLTNAMGSFLAKHATSLRYITVRFHSSDANIPSQMTASFMAYLASARSMLETLEIWPTKGISSLNGDDFLVSVATACPNLITLIIPNACSAEKLCLLCELCPHLQYVSIQGTICIDEAKRIVSVVVMDSTEDWVPCLSYALRRRQYKQVTLQLWREVNYHPVGNLKAMLELYELGVVTYASEASLIAILQDLPHLNTLDITIDRRYTDATLTAITQHAKSLTKISMMVDESVLNNLHNADKLFSKIIEACQMLKCLAGACCGLESLLAASRRTNLTDVYLCIYQLVSAESLDNIMTSDEVKWSSSLETGEVVPVDNSFSWKFNKKCHHWTKHESN